LFPHVITFYESTDHIKSALIQGPAWFNVYGSIICLQDINFALGTLVVSDTNIIYFNARVLIGKWIERTNWDSNKICNHLVYVVVAAYTPFGLRIVENTKHPKK
jgi:hypothetical protein